MDKINSALTIDCNVTSNQKVEASSPYFRVTLAFPKYERRRNRRETGYYLPQSLKCEFRIKWLDKA